MRVDWYLELDDPPSIAIVDALPFLPQFGIANIEGGPNVLEQTLDIIGGERVSIMSLNSLALLSPVRKSWGNAVASSFSSLL
jgi:hypothetical protein